MPYIPVSERTKVTNGHMPNAGCLNYATHQLIDLYLEQHDNNYQAYNDIIGVLECVKQELYRRKIVDYEQLKIVQNGDCAPYDVKHH